MWRIIGAPGKDICDAGVQVSRRDVLRVGGTGIAGLSLGNLLQLKAAQASSAGGGPGWNKAKRLILVYLQGGPSHIDLWDPKETSPKT